MSDKRKKRWEKKSDGLDLGCSTGNKCNLHGLLKAVHQSPSAIPAWEMGLCR